MIYEFEGKSPVIGKNAYIFENTTIIGNVHIGDNVWIGPGAVLRGDYGTINVGSYSAIEDNCVIHARPGEETVIGEHVTIGHLSVIHTGKIGDFAVIGMNSTVSDFATIGEWAAIGEGAVVKNNSIIPEKSIAVGVPARVVGTVSDDYMALWKKYKENYNSFCTRYAKNLHKYNLD